MGKTVLIAGSAVTDFIYDVPAFPTRPEKYKADDFRMSGGGCAGNAAVAIARLGGRAELVARMGDDLVGLITVQDLQREGVDCSRVLTRKGGRSALSSIYVTPDGERQIMAFRGDGLAETPDVTGARPDAILADTRWPQATRAVLTLARDLGVPGVLDGESPVTDEEVSLATHVAFSAQGLRDYSGEVDQARALETAAGRAGGWVCVTDGARGVFWRAGGRSGHVPAVPVKAVDTLAAGDVWHGAFTLRLAEGAGEDAAIAFANAAAGLKCTRPGGRAGSPSRSETDELLQGIAT